MIEPKRTNIIEYGGRVPPQAIEVEEAILGSILIEESAIESVLDILHASDFYKEAHRLIFEAMVELHREDQPVDLVTVSEKLKAKGKLENVGGSFYIADLSQRVPSAANAAHYSRIVQGKAQLRKLIQIGSEVTTLAFQETEDPDVLARTVEDQVYALTTAGGTGFRKVSESLQGSMERLQANYQARKEGKLTGLDTGIHRLNDLLGGGLQPELVVLAGRPSMGKTAFALSIAFHVGLKLGKHVGIFSLEMSEDQVNNRLLAMGSSIDLSKFRSGAFTEDDWNRLEAVSGKLYEATIHVDATPSIDINVLGSRAKKLKKQKKIELLIVDLLTLITTKKTFEKRALELKSYTGYFVQLKKQLNIPIIVVHQLNREVDKSKRRPQLSDLKDSGSIEEDADTVILLHREDYYNEDPGDQSHMEIIVAKGRDSGTGVVHTEFLRKKNQFLQRTNRRDPDAQKHEF